MRSRPGSLSLSYGGVGLAMLLILRWVGATDRGLSAERRFGSKGDPSAIALAGIGLCATAVCFGVVAARGRTND